MVGFLIFVAVVLLFIILFQIARATDLSSSIKGKEDSETTSRIQANISLWFMIFGLIGVVWSFFYLKDDLLGPSASEHGKEIDRLFNMTLFFTGIVFFLCQILLYGFVFKFRERKERKAKFFPHDNKLEIIWTVIPAIVLTVLVVQGVGAWMRITAPVSEAIQIEAVAKQFEWLLHYPGKDEQLGNRDFRLVDQDGGNTLGLDWQDAKASDDVLANELVVPVDTTIMVKINSLDVLHSFNLPHFRVKMDAVPGTPTYFAFKPEITTDSMRIVKNDSTFNYELACTELCGKGHSSMRKVVRVVSMEEYLAWESAQKPFLEILGGDDQVRKQNSERKERLTPQWKKDAEAHGHDSHDAHTGGHGTGH